MTDPPRMGLCILALCWVLPPALVQSDLKPAYAGKFGNFTSPRSTPSGPSDIVHVAPPTGERDADRTSILAALERARPGDTIQFAAGTYLVGERIKVPTPRLTVLGHPAGTTLRGCDPDAYEEMERTVARTFKDMRAVPPRASPSDMSVTVFRCGMLELIGGHAAVRHLTFEYTRAALILGCCADEFRVRPGDGGYRIEDNTFRNLDIAILTWLASTDPTVIRGNTIVNTFHAVSGSGSHVHVLNNAISAPGSERVPGRGHPGFAINIGSAPGDSLDPAANGCENVIARNRVEGHPDGIIIQALPGTVCRRNVIRDNTIVFRRVHFTESAPWVSIFFPTAKADSTITGMPLALASLPDETGRGGVLEDNLIEGNRVVGAEGVGIELSRTSRNRIVNNSITGIAPRRPFPGNTLGPRPQWQEANGSGVWVSPGSDENEILGNTFGEIASHAVVLAGDRNRVETRSANDSVRDLGRGNTVIRAGAQGPSPPGEWTDPSPHTVRFVTVAPGVRLEVLDWGGTGEPLVFLAGLTFTGHTFDDLAARFTDRFRVLAITRRGFGASSQPADGYDLDTLTKDVRIVLDNLGVERAALVGHSMGVHEITRFANLWPARVSALVNLDEPIFLDAGADLRDIPPPRTETDLASVAAYIGYHARVYGFRPPESEIRAQHRVQNDGRVGERVTPERIPQVLFEGSSAVARAAIRGEALPLDRLGVPVLAIVNRFTTIPWYQELGPGDRKKADQAFPALLRSWTEAWERYARMSGARVVDLPDASHHLYLSHPHDVFAAMWSFLISPSGR